MANLRLLNQTNKYKSFTLIEILLVVVILGVLAGFALPNFSQTYSKMKVRETAKNITFLMEYAQSRAITQQKEHRIEFDVQNRKYRVAERISSVLEEDAQGRFKRISGRYGRTFLLPEGVMVETPSPLVFFRPNGDIDEVRIYVYNERDNYFTISTQAQSGYVMLFDFKVSE